MESPPPLTHDVASSSRGHSRAAVAIGTLLVSIVVVLLCLIPKPENDLFWELRTGMDILHSHHLPRVDAYSWVRRGAHWDVPEWLAFTAYALAYRFGGFFGDILLMMVLTVGAALVVWFWTVECVGVIWAFLLTNLTLLAMSDCLQTRPYAFSYLFLAISLVLLIRSRSEVAAASPLRRLRSLMWLPAICVVWTNCHQGVLVLVCILLTYAAVDAVMAVWTHYGIPSDAINTSSPSTEIDLPSESQAPLPASGRGRGRGRDVDLRSASQAPLPLTKLDTAGRGHGPHVPSTAHARTALVMLATAALCACAVMVTPYGWHVYSNVYVTMDNPVAMANVTEWNSAAVLPFDQLRPFLLIAVIAFGSLAASPRRSLADTAAVAVLFGESLLHARNIALFAIGAAIIAAPHFGWAAAALRVRLGLAEQPSTAHGALLTFFALFYVLTVGLVAYATLLPAIGPHGWSTKGIGEAAVREPAFPNDACTFVEKEGFPPNLRLINNFSIGGYLIWRLPSEPVFTDGRLDLYAGKPFADMIVLSRNGGSPVWKTLVQSLNVDCVITTSASLSRAFAAEPGWQLVYQDLKRPHKYTCRIFLLRSRFPALIARCLHDRPCAVRS